MYLYKIRNLHIISVANDKSLILNGLSYKRIQSNISSVVEFQRWWFLKSKILAKNQHTKRKISLNILMKNDNLPRIGLDFISKVVQKLSVVRIFFFYKKSLPDL